MPRGLFSSGRIRRSFRLSHFEELTLQSAAQATQAARAEAIVSKGEDLGVGASWQALVQRLTPLLLNPLAEPDFQHRLSVCVQDLAALVHHDPDLAIFLLVNPSPQARFNYGVEHPVHTAVLMALIAQHKEWPEGQVEVALSAALSMNLSITQLQTDLANQALPPNAAQKEAIHHHPARSRDMLVSLGVMQMDWLRAVQEHHEQHNGSGYPNGVRIVSPLSDALRTCDMFSAKLSERASRSKMLSTRAAQEIFRQNSYGYFGATIVRILGMYPPGCLVKLLSGATALVLQRTTDPLRPRVAVLTHDNGELRDVPLYIATGVEPGTSVVGAIADNELAQHFSLSQLYGAVRS